MASGLFDYGRARFLQGDLLWKVNTSQDFRAALIDTAVTAPNLATHQYHSDLASAIVGTPVSFTASALTSAAGVADGSDIVFTAVSGAHVEGVVIYQWTGTSGTSPLVAWLEFTQLTPNGGNITVQWDSGAYKIFKL